ncbi:MAG: MFS transporter [Firmicutes bacterium]|nr:MFS transporter [Bacillota bacterium]
MKRIFYGWFVVFACALMLFTSIGMVGNNFSIFMPLIRGEYGITHAQTSSLVTIRCFVSFVFMWFLGVYYDKLGTRIGAAVAVSFAAFGYLIFSLGDTYAVFCIGAAVMGACNAFASMAPVSVLMNSWFIKNKALAVGICGMGSGIAMMVMPSITTALYEGFGLSQAFRLECFFMLGLAVLTFLLIRNEPEDMGLKPLGYEEYKDIVAEADIRNLFNEQTEKPMSRTLWISILSASICMGCLANPGYSHLSVLFTTAGFDAMQVAGLISTIGFILTFSKLVFGRLVDKIGGFKSTMIYGGILTAGHIFCCLVYSHSTLINIGIVACMGIGYAITTLSATIWSNDIADKNNYAVVVRRLQIAQSAGALVFSTVPGVLADRFGNYVPAYALFTALMFASLFMVAISYRQKAKAA